MITSLDNIRPTTIEKLFKKYGISNALGGREDDALYEVCDSSSSDEDVSGFEDEDYSVGEDN